MKLEKILFIPDTHSPYQDKKAWALMMKAAKAFKPEHVVILGDFADFYSVSSHSKDPSRAYKLDEELKETIRLLKQLKTLKAKKYTFIAGNHCDRLQRYLQDKAPELNKLVNVADLLKLKELDFSYVPYKRHTRIGKLYITHDCGNAGRFAHNKALDTFQHNIMIGHTHRIGYSVEGNAEGERHLGVMLGWLGDIEEVDYMHRVKIARDWSLGFGIGYLDKESDNVYVVPIPIVNYTCVVEGQLFR